MTNAIEAVKLRLITTMPLDVYRTFRELNIPKRKQGKKSLVVFLTSDSKRVIVAKGPENKFISPIFQTTVCEAFDCVVLERIPSIDISFMADNRTRPDLRYAVASLCYLEGVAPEAVEDVFQHHWFFFPRNRQPDAGRFRDGSFAFYETKAPNVIVWIRGVTIPPKVDALKELGAQFLFRKELKDEALA